MWSFAGPVFELLVEPLCLVQSKSSMLFGSFDHPHKFASSKLHSLRGGQNLLDTLISSREMSP